jgi:transposase InsO family protein
MAELRADVVTEPARLGCTVRETCERWEISRQSYYRWKKRYELWGPQGLEDLARVPFNSPRRIDSGLEDLICRMRKDHPRWGARTIRNHLRRRNIAPPAISTIHRVLVRNNLVAPRPRRRPVALKRFERQVPNDLWQMDAVEVPLTNGAVPCVMNVLDDHARYLLASVPASSPTCEAAWAAFSTAAERYGLPRQVLTDNHLSFTGRRYHLVVEFERRLRAAGPTLINGRPRHPETQGKIERLHRTLREWLHDEGPPTSVEHLTELLERFREHYNHHRPHQSLPGDVTPAERFMGSPEPFEAEEPLEEQPAYPADAVVRTVTANGVITYSGTKIGVGVRWARRRVRVVRVAELTQVYFGDRLIRSLTIDPSRGYQYFADPQLKGRRPRLDQV